MLGSHLCLLASIEVLLVSVGIQDDAKCGDHVDGLALRVVPPADGIRSESC